ncbi:hypothetical protein ACET3Z_013680 [Daucus carota]
MARKQRMPPATVSQPLQNDAVEEHAASSESERSPVKRTVTPDPKQKSGSKPDPRRSRKRGSEKEEKVGVSKNARVEKNSSAKRVWSDEDAIAIVQGLIDYELEYDEDPRSDYEAFFEYVKDSLQAKVSLTQLKEKIKTLKRKYKSLKDSDAVFAKPIEEELFRLSDTFWGQGNDNQGNAASKDKDMSIEIIEDGVVENGRKDKDTSIGINDDDGVNEDDGKQQDTSIGVNENGGNEGGDEDDEDGEENEAEGLGFKELYPNLSRAWESDIGFGFPQALKDLTMRNLKLHASEKMRALDKEWKDLLVKELQLYVDKLELKTKLAKVALDQMLSSDP